MKKFLMAATALSLLATPMAAMAQPDRHDDHNNMMMQNHDDHRGGPGMMAGAPHQWRQGDHIDRGNWGHYDRVDYRRYHLRQPPRGYEWRRVDNNYVLAAAATGLIASVIAASR
jgi:Ni/Co efflux regulator RcnB